MLNDAEKSNWPIVKLKCKGNVARAFQHAGGKFEGDSVDLGVQGLCEPNWLVAKTGLNNQGGREVLQSEVTGLQKTG